MQIKATFSEQYVGAFNLLSTEEVALKRVVDDRFYCTGLFPQDSGTKKIPVPRWKKGWQKSKKIWQNL